MICQECGDPLEEHDAPCLPREDEAPRHAAGRVAAAPNFGYFVQSRTTPGVWYLVFRRTCSCEAGRRGMEHCYHRGQVAAYAAEQNRRTARPAAPVNVSALVD